MEMKWDGDETDEGAGVCGDMGDGKGGVMVVVGEETKG